MSLIESIIVISVVLSLAIGYTLIYVDFVKSVRKYEENKLSEMEYCPSEESED